MRKKKDRYHYFVSYHSTNEYGASGIGRLEISIDCKINNMDVVKNIEKYIREKYGYENVVIINYILLGVNIKK